MQHVAHAVTLLKFMIKRDRFTLPAWLIGIVALTLTIPPALNELFPTEQDRQSIAETMNNPVMVALVGPGELQSYTIGAMTSHQMLLFTALLVGIMNVLILTRHLRGDEEEGRLELLRALPVGKLAPMVAVGFYALILNTGLAVLTGIGLAVLQIDSMGIEGSLLYGALLGGVGLLSAALTALASQVMDHAGGAIGFAVVVLIFFYMLRAIGDVSSDLLTSLSPLGWLPRGSVYVDNHWWPLFALVGVSLFIYAIAVYIQLNRDLNKGIVTSTSGNSHGSRLLLSPLGFPLRLQRTSMLTWSIGLLIIGATYGSILGDLDTFFEGNELIQQMLLSGGATIIEQFLPMLITIMAITATVPALLSIHRLYTEEKSGRLEHLITRAYSRTTVMIRFSLIAVINGVMSLLFSGLGLWLASSLVLDEPLSIVMLLQAFMSYVPAILLTLSLSLLFIGIIPQLKLITWLLLLYAFFSLYLGGLLDLPNWANQLSPFGWVPQIPVEDASIAVPVIMTVLAFGLFLLAIFTYKKRDLHV